MAAAERLYTRLAAIMALSQDAVPISFINSSVIANDKAVPCATSFAKGWRCAPEQRRNSL